MPVVQTFEEMLDSGDRPAALASAMSRLPAEAAVRRLSAAGDPAALVAPASAPAADGPEPAQVQVQTEAQTQVQARDLGAVPVPEPLAGLLPGGLRRGEAAALPTRGQGQGLDYLALALLAEALKAGLWCAAVGVADLGLAALSRLLGPAARCQAALDRLLLVPQPGEQWAEITATLADGVDLLLLRPTTPAPAATAQRVDARLRQGRSAGTRHSAALLVLGGWPTARLAMHIARTDWTGLDGVGPTAGTGHLTAGRATVVAQGRATAGRPRVTRLWLPDETGAVRALSDGPRRGSTGRGAPPVLVPLIPPASPAA